MKKNYAGILLLLLWLSSCKKEKITLLTQEVPSNTTHQLHDVVFVNDSVGYICGGEKWSIGIFMRTTNGGKTWSMPDSIFNACAYSMQFLSVEQGTVVGNSSNWATTSDSGKTFSVRQSDYLPINDVAILNSNTIVKVGSPDYGIGYISYTTNGGSSWIKTDLPHNMMDIQLVDSQTFFTCGYGALYKSENAGQSFHPLDVRGDFFCGARFSNTYHRLPGRLPGYDY